MDLTNVPPAMLKAKEESDRILAQMRGEQPVIEEKKEEAVVASEPEEKKEETPPESVVTEEMTKEQRYKVLIGMQQAEAKKARQAKAEAEALAAELEALRKQVAAPPPPPAPDPDDELLDEAFGTENLARLEARFKRRGFVRAEDLNTVRSEIGSIAKTQKMTEDEFFRAQMNELVPGWEQRNVDPKFIEFSQQPEGHTGYTRADFMRKHYEDRNAARLAAYFNEFSPEAPPQKAKPDKKKMTSPSSTPGAARQVVEKEEPEFKLSDYQKFAYDVKTGKYRGREAEMQAIDAKFNAAMRAGRLS